MFNNSNLNDNEILKIMHDQASIELSQGKNIISNRAYRNWNSSAYRYDRKRQSYVLKKEINVGADVPRIIKW